MEKVLILFLLTFYSTSSFSEAGKEQENEATKKRSKLMELINKEISTIKNNKYTGPELKHRLFELFSEKIKLIKENENLAFLKSDPKGVATNGKESYFKNSHEQYSFAQTFALKLIKDHPRYNRINEIYYALATNSRDYGTNEETEQFLKLSISTNAIDPKTIYNAKTSLAEFYYNNKRYHDAISYYQDILKNSNNEWYGKHLYNASWCYLKERNFKKALELIKGSFETTKNKNFVSMREQIINAIGIFYIQADAIHEGIEFYQNNTSPSAPWLLTLATSSMNKNNFPLTYEILQAALKDTQKRKDPNMEMKVRLAELNIYRESKKDELYFETSNNILALSKKNKIDTEDITIAINKIKEVAGFMQINLVKDKIKEEVKYIKDDYKKIMRYFDILSSLDKKNKNQYRYFQGETALSIHDYKTALNYYVRSVTNSKTIKDGGEVTRKSIEAMLSIIELANLKKQNEDAYAIFAFKNYVIFYPQSDKSQTIYQKLFSKYLELHDIKKAINTLLVYNYYYKDDEKIHREMLTQVLDIYIKEKNTDKLAFWINKIEKGYLNFSADYVQNSIAVLGGLLFDKYQTLEKLEKYAEAMKGYESIYHSRMYPKRTKAEAAYAIATLYQDQNKAKDSSSWLTKSLDIYESKDLLKVTSSLLALVKGYRLLQNFDLSSKFSGQILKRFCDENFPQKNDFYELITQNSITTDNNSTSLIKTEDEYKKCNIEKRFLEKNQLQNLEQLITSNNSNEITSYFKAHSDNEKLARSMGRFLKSKFWRESSNQKEKTKAEIITMNEAIPALGLDGMFDQYNHVLEFRNKVQALKFEFSNLPKFDDEKYNFELEQYFSIITELNNEAMALSKKSIPEEIVLIREVLSIPYFSLVNSINSYTPQGVDNNYREGFKKGMRQITESLNSKGLQLDREKMTYLEKNIFFFETQKYDRFSNITGGKNELNFHLAILFSSTMDLTRGQKK